MPQGIICISPITAFKETIDLTIDPALIDLGKLKDALLLPNRYIIERVHKPIYGPYRDCAEIIVSSPDIPETPDEEALPIVTPIYTSEPSEDFKTRTVSLGDIMISAVSAIREEDKECKRIIEVKEIKDVSVGSARDTQFAGYAKLLVEEIINEVPATIYPLEIDISDKLEKLLARRAYDFAKHAFYGLDVWRSGSLDIAVQSIPDLNKWPDEAEYPRTNQ